MELPLTVKLSKQAIAKLYRTGRIGQDFNDRLDEIIMDIYEDGRELGLTESLNYVSNEIDRQKLFEAIDQLAEARNNEC